MKCASCSNKKTLKATKRTVKYTECGLDNVMLEGVLVYSCPECGEEYFDYGNILQLHTLIKNAIMKKAGLIEGAHIRFLRKYFGYSKEHFADLVGVNARTVYRWESGRNINPQVDKTVRMLFATSEVDRNYDYHDVLLLKAKAMQFTNLKIKHDKSGVSWQYA